MDKLEEKHIALLRQASAQPFKKHPSDLPFEDLEQMIAAGLLIKYNGSPAMFAVTKLGSQVAKSFGASPELIKIAEDFVVSRGYTEESAKNIVAEYGAEHILRTKAEDAAEGSSGQRGVKPPTDERGNVQFKPVKS